MKNHILSSPLNLHKSRTGTVWLSAAVSLPILRHGCDMTKPCGVYNHRHVEKKRLIGNKMLKGEWVFHFGSSL